MDKLPICLIMLLAVLLNSCGRKSSTAVPGKGSDSIYRYDHIYHIAISEPQRALALADTAETAVSVHSELSGYSGGGYVTGLSVNKVANGGGLRWAVNVPESGLYNVSLNYQSKTETTANIYVGNTARTFDGTKTELSLPVSGQWNEASVAVYLQKGMNIVDVDTAAEISLDYMRIQGSARSADYAETTQAADTVPESADTEDVPYYVWQVKAVHKGHTEQ